MVKSALRSATAAVLVCGLTAGDAAANAAPGKPALVSPATGATLNANGAQIFTVRATDPDGDPYRGWVTVFDAVTGEAVESFDTAPSPSGQTSSAMPPVQLEAGDYTWTASASDVLGNQGPSPLPRAFSVAGSAEAGGGAFTGQLSYSQELGTPCADTTLSLQASSAAAILSFAPANYVGSMTFTGSGSSACETLSSGTGTLTLSANGLGVGATTIDCAQLTGQYSRVATHLRALVSGDCSIDGAAPDTASFEIEADLVPRADGGLAEADLDGAFTLSALT